VLILFFFFYQVKLGIQLYQVDHRSYLLDFRNLNAKTDGHHPILSAQDGLFLRSCF
jgi:hypothetical protein